MNIPINKTQPRLEPFTGVKHLTLLERNVNTYTTKGVKHATPTYLFEDSIADKACVWSGDPLAGPDVKKMVEQLDAALAKGPDVRVTCSKRGNLDTFHFAPWGGFAHDAPAESILDMFGGTK